ncbi:sulfatase-like hydrolase/transferase [Alcaligenes aquatilis]|uniref:Sulfatase-like hydrolase/transferase n=1 Tax=Alcaligenes aquatilis TaxID=323284 RepID=A0ABY4NI39_9BURK|nr:sulfatase-like hydrolase/transferase [Alcaligenes aquatilis]UQN36456.1 sulfatase-like hydrolase/transferase [Alcaligenes aquatilis]
MTQRKNVLFIMADQLRADHLACYGHPHIRTPHLDALAAKGVRFDRAFVNSGVCGPSRMSYYTGRYPSTHGATWNRVPLSVGEVTMGEYLRAGGHKLVLAGKTHIMVDHKGLERLALDGGSELARLLKTGGFEEIDRYDGHHEPGEESGYPAYLRRHGYQSDDPWTDFVISARGPDGEAVSGWHMRNARYPSLVEEKHSETAYMTDQALSFMERMGDEPWVLHLSYVKPHWPYIAPAPYHDMYSADQCLPVVRNEAELSNAHPVLEAYRQQEECVSFSSDACVETVRPAYQGLITQLDDHLGRLFDFMSRNGLMDNTLIIFTADHGDFLGDHWLGEKELFYDTVQRVPFIVYDPSPEANATRGTVDDRMVEAVDVLPTMLSWLGLPPAPHRIEGRDLLPLLRGAQPPWRDCVFSELDYSYRLARVLRDKSPSNARAWSLRSDRWRYVYWLDEPEQLYDLHADPEQFNDLGRSADHEHIREECRERLLQWFTSLKRRTTVTDEEVERGTNAYKKAGVFFGQW